MTLKQKCLITLRPCGVVEGVVASRVVPRVALEAVDVVAGWKKKSLYLLCCQMKKCLPALLPKEKKYVCSVATLKLLYMKEMFV
jgi:hypothetical protein